MQRPRYCSFRVLFLCAQERERGKGPFLALSSPRERFPRRWKGNGVILSDVWVPSLSTYSSSSPPLPLHSFAFGLAAARMLCVFSATAMDPCIFSFRVRNIVCGEAPPTNFAKSASAMTSVTSCLSSGEPLVTFFSLPGRSSRDHFVPSMSKTMRPYDFSLRWRWRRWKWRWWRW